MFRTALCSPVSPTLSSKAEVLAVCPAHIVRMSASRRPIPQRSVAMGPGHELTGANARVPTKGRCLPFTLTFRSQTRRRGRRALSSRLRRRIGRDTCHSTHLHPICRDRGPALGRGTDRLRDEYRRWPLVRADDVLLFADRRLDDVTLGV